jgi:hypothetical protein
LELAFVDDLKFGNRLEVYTLDWLRQRDIECELVEASAYDIILPKTNAKLEVKADRWVAQTQNLCLELYSHLPLGSEGWLQYSTADVLVYLSVQDNEVDEMDFYNLPSLRGYVFDKVLKHNWLCTEPLIGRIVSSSSSPNVRNLLLPKSDAVPYLIYIEGVNK